MGETWIKVAAGSDEYALQTGGLQDGSICFACGDGGADPETVKKIMESITTAEMTELLEKEQTVGTG